MRCRWVVPPLRERGNGYGYAILNRELRAAAEQAGLVIDETAPLALHLMPPLRFAPLPGVTNVIFTMWESEDFPAELRPYLDQADAVIVPCRWNVGIFRAVYPGPVLRCPLGIDPDVFRPVRRVWQPGEAFRWLWVGAPNGRKGPDVIEAAWERFFQGHDDCELYLKTSGRCDAVVTEALRVAGWMEHAERLWSHRNVSLDMRRLATGDLVQLYQMAHGYLFPTGGEGWGLTCHEALATGLPTIATAFGGHLDFVDAEIATLLPYEAHRSEFELPENACARFTVTSALVRPETLRDAMLDVMARYHMHLRRAREGSRRARALTWDRAGRRLVHLLTTVQPSAAPSAASAATAA